MTSLSKKLLLCFCLCFGFIEAAAQYRFDQWTADDGLPQNSVYGIVQTRDGYLWLATLDGLARFDGVKFTTFNSGNTPDALTVKFRLIELSKTFDSSDQPSQRRSSAAANNNYLEKPFCISSRQNGRNSTIRAKFLLFMLEIFNSRLATPIAISASSVIRAPFTSSKSIFADHAKACSVAIQSERLGASEQPGFRGNLFPI